MWVLSFFTPQPLALCLPHSMGQRTPEVAVPMGTKFRTPLNLQAFASFLRGKPEPGKFGTKLPEPRWTIGSKCGNPPMSDVAYLRKLAERYRKLARSFKHATIRDRLETLADDLEQKVRELQRPLPGMPIIRRYNPIN